MLSLDRYATVKHPRLAQLRERRFLPIVLAASAWLGAFLLCAPLLLAYRLSTGTEPPLVAHNATDTAVQPAPTGRPPLLSSSLTSGIPSQTLLPPPQPPDRHAGNMTNTTNTAFSQLVSRSGYDADHRQPPPVGTCYADYGTAQMHRLYAGTYACLAFVLPAIGVLLNHLGVRKKLCALSLTARAAHGELPLPMPILRRPTHMIIVTGMANAGRAVGDADSCCGSADDDNGDAAVMDGGAALVDNDNDMHNDPDVMAVAQPDAGPNGATTRGPVDEPPAAADICAVDEKRCMMAETRMRCNPRTPR